MELTQENVIIILSALLAVSEALALVPSIKQNSIFEVSVSILKKLLGK